MSVHNDFEWTIFNIVQLKISPLTAIIAADLEIDTMII